MKNLTSSQQGLLNGIISYVIDVNSWGSSGYPTNDWGLSLSDVLLERFLGLISLSIVVTIAIGRQWKAVSTPVSRLITPIVFYYDFIATCNNVTSVVDPATASPTSKNYLGIALAYRAMAYLDIARQFEFKKTGNCKFG